MTLIAYKDGVLCADSQRQADGLVTGTPVLKIARRADGNLFGASGTAPVALHWMRWFLAGENGEPPYRETGANFDAVMVVRADGRIDYWSSVVLAEERVDDRFGLGYSAYLHGLMDAGLGATESIKSAMKRDRDANYPLIELRHFGPPIIWTSETEQGDPAEFFKACGVKQSDFIHDVKPAELAAA